MCGWDGDGQIWVEYTDRVPDEETAIRFGQGLGGSDGWAIAAIEMLGVEFSPMPSPNDPEYGRWYWHLRWPDSVAYVGSAFVPGAELSLNPDVVSAARRFLAYPGGTVVVGQTDPQTAVGIESDLERDGVRNRETWAEWLERAVAKALEVPLWQRTSITFRKVDDRLVGALRIQDDY